MSQNLHISSSNPHYSGWDQEIFDGLGLDKSKEAYRLAAYLHDGINRKNGLPYLTHINGSLQKLNQYIEIFGNKFNKSGYQMYICLHDIIEDDDDGVELIEQDFGIDMLIGVLWMSVPKKRVRDGIAKLIQRKPEYGSRLASFTAIHLSAATGKPTDDGFHDSLTFLLGGDWHNQWEAQYSEQFDQQKENREEQRDIFAKYIFGGMVENMPEHLFLVKCIERLDNLSDRDGLKNPRDTKNYIRTAILTENIYCKRLDTLGYIEFADILRLELAIGVNQLQGYIRSQVDKNTIST